MKKFFILTLFFSFPLLTSLFSYDLEDLTEGEEPLYGSKKRERYRSTAIFWEVEDWQDHYSENILFLYKYINYPKYTSTRFFPFYYRIQSKMDARKYSRFLNYRVLSKEQEFEKSFFPFFFWGENKVYSKIYFTFFPFFSTEEQNLKGDNSYKFLSPIFYYSRKEKADEFQNISLSTEFILPIYRKVSKKKKNFEFVSYSIPFLPILYYYSRENQTKFFSLFWIYGSEENESKFIKNYLFPFWYSVYELQNRESFFISPIYFRKKTNDYESKAYLWMLYMWENNYSRGWNFLGIASASLNENNLRENYLFPFWYYKERQIFLSLLYSKIQNSSETLEFGPLFFYMKSNYSKTIWFLNFYNSQKAEQSYAHLFPIFEYETSFQTKIITIFYLFKKQNSQNESKLNLFPFYSYEQNSSGYRYSFLFGLYGLGVNQNNDLETAKFLPFYYYQKDGMLFTPVYVRFGNLEFPEGKIFSPFYNRIWNEEYKFKNLLVYFEYTSKKDIFQTVFPFWWRWSINNKNGNILFPFYATYTNEVGEEVNLNILGLVQATRTGILQPDLSLGQKENRFYLDTDISWFYSLFRISTRISAANPFLKYTPQVSPSKELAQESPSLSKKKYFTRENSNFFWGYSALFSSIAYEKGDSKRHFRIFPLLWFTWSEENEDKLLLFPPILPIAFYYNTPELKYIAFVPFYGEQTTPDTQIRAVFINFYIKEEYSHNKLKEISIFWPFWNSYISDEENGFRIFPMFWYKKSETKNIYHFRNFSLLHYYSDYKDELLSLSKKKFFFPIYYFSELKLENLEHNRFEIQSFSWSLLHFSREEKVKFGKNNFLGEKSFFSLIYIAHEDYNQKISRSFYPIFLLYRKEDENEKYYNFAFIGNWTQKEDFSSIGLGLIWDLIGVEYRKNLKLSDSKFWIFPFIYRFKESYKKESLDSYSSSSLNYFFPFLFHFKKDVYENGKLRDSSWILLTPLYFKGLVESQVQRETETTFYTIPFLYTHSSKDFFSVRLWLFISYNSFSSNEIEFSLWPIYPIFYYDSQTSHLNFLGVIFDRKKTDGYFRFYLFPVWYSTSEYFSVYKESKENYRNSFFHILPIYFSETLTSYPTSNLEFKFFSLGLYYEKKKQNVYWNYLFLANYESGDSEEKKFSFLFSIFRFESSQGFFESSVFYDLVWSSKIQKNFSKYTFLFNTYQKEKEFFYIRFFPIFSLENGISSFDFFFYPTLSSYEKNERKQTLYHFLGILYSSENNFLTKEIKSQSFLTLLYNYEEYPHLNGREKRLDLLPFGFLYSYEFTGDIEFSEKETIGWGSIFLREKKIENGYHRFGSVWGWLWQYEYEETTDYRKFSILKLLSYEFYKGTTRIFGIPIN